MANMMSHQQRVVAESEELGVKLTKLQVFLKSEMFKTLPLGECMRLARQADYMEGYLQVLRERIAAFR